MKKRKEEDAQIQKEFVEKQERINRQTKELAAKDKKLERQRIAQAPMPNPAKGREAFCGPPMAQPNYGFPPMNDMGRPQGGMRQRKDSADLDVAWRHCKEMREWTDWSETSSFFRRQ